MNLAHLVAREAAEPKVVFTPRERTINNFSGRKDSVQTVDELIEDIELTLKTRPTSDDENVNFITSHLEGPAREEIRYRSADEKKKPKDILAIFKEVFGERETTFELLSDFYPCKQEEETIQEYCHKLMCKLDRICKKDPGIITDRDIALRNQFAENIKPVWLERELKKRLRTTPSITFSDIREEATLLMDDSQESVQNTPATSYEFDTPVLAAQSIPRPLENSDLSALLQDLNAEMKCMIEELKSLKVPNKNQKATNTRLRYYCEKPGHFKKYCRKRIRDFAASGATDLNGPGLRLRADL